MDKKIMQLMILAFIIIILSFFFWKLYKEDIKNFFKEKKWKNFKFEEDE